MTAAKLKVLARRAPGGITLRDVFGWNRPFRENDIKPELLHLMQLSEILQPDPRGVRSRLRVASLDDDLFFHSSYPTDEPDAVFFGPDTYRFARFMRDRWPATGARRVVDMGAGSGAGGIAAARLAPDATVALIDHNPEALRLAKLNALAAGVTVDLRQDSVLPPGADMIIANPPYMIDAAKRAYRDGGALLGGGVALQWVRDALGKLDSGGTMLLYTGAPIIGGIAPLVEALQGACAEAGAALEVDEIDPDVFGEELEQQAYSEIERIAAVGVVIRIVT